MGKNVVYDIENSQYPLEFVYWFILNVPCIRPIIAKLVLKNDYIKCCDMLPMWLCLGMGKKKNSMWYFSRLHALNSHNNDNTLL